MDFFDSIFPCKDTVSFLELAQNNITLNCERLNFNLKINRIFLPLLIQRLVAILYFYLIHKERVTIINNIRFKILYELIIRNTVKIYSEFYELLFQMADKDD